MTDDYALQPTSESDIKTMEDEIYKLLCANHLTAEVAAWLAIHHSHMVRLANRIARLEAASAR